MGIFSGIENAKARVDANYVRPCDFYARINQVKADRTRKDEDFVVVEMTVIKVLEIPEDSQGHRTGEDVSHLMMCKHDSFQGNMKALVANMLGMDASEVKEEHCEAVCAKDQPMQGMVAQINAREVRTRADKPFTVVNYRREVPASELLEVLSEQEIERFFPDGYLTKVAEAEAAAGQA